MEIEWCSVNFLTGQRGTLLRTDSAGKVSRIIGAATDATIKVRCSHDGVQLPGWDEGTEKGRNLIVAVDKDGDQIIWGGLVRRRSSTKGPWVEVGANTLESYLFRRYINTPLSWSDADPTQVAVDALAQITDVPPLEVDAVMTGNPVIDGFFDSSDNKRIGELLVDLSGLAGGVEWTVDLEWADAAHTQMRYVVRLAPRLGTAAAAMTAPTQWTMPGAVRDFSFIEDFGEETGANDVLALSSGEGDSKPTSTRYEDTALLAAFARFERRFTPATSITSLTTLDQYAEAELTATRLGLTQLNLEANLDAAPQVNRDWWLGDDIDVALTCDRFPRQLDADGFWEAGYTRRLRTVGWDLDFDSRTVTPRILEAD